MYSDLRAKIKALGNELSDFTINVGNRKFETHKLILAAHSDYFRAMFKQKNLESDSNMVSYSDDLKFLTVKTMEDILEFCYSLKIDLTDDNVPDLLLAASFLQIQDLKSICIDYFKERLDATNCTGFMSIAHDCNLELLFKYSFEYCLDNFTDIIKQNEFVHIDPSLLNKILSHNELDSSEWDIFQACLHWHSADPEGRQKYLEELLSNVRFIFMDKRSLVEISRMPVIRNMDKLIYLIDQTKNRMILEDDLDALAVLPPIKEHLLEKRKPFRLEKKCIFAIGGWKPDKTIAGVERYNPREDKWTLAKPMNTPRFGVAAAVHDNLIYAFGGHDGKSDLKSVERYDVVTDTWLEDVAMRIERTSCCAITIGDEIHVLGGENTAKHRWLNDIEVFDVKNEKWKYFALHKPRLGAGIAFIDGYIYLVGGARADEFSHVERKHIDGDEWVSVASLNSGRKHLGCTTYKGKIYAVGGKNSRGETFSSAECYDPETNQWTYIPSMRDKRHGLGLIELDGLIYAVGGNDGQNELNSVEAYDTETGVWFEKQSLIEARLGSALAVVEIPRSYELANGRRSQSSDDSSLELCVPNK